MTLRVITVGWSTSKVYLVLEKSRTILSKIVSERIVWLWLRPIFKRLDERPEA
jgi:hypothetical protein